MIKTYTAMPSTDEKAVLNTLVCEPSDKNIKIKGLIQIVHGMTEHIDRYEEFAEYFTSQGYVVFGNDIISHGRSLHDKTHGLYINKWEDAITDIHEMKKVVREKYPDKPLFLLGFSLGSFLVRSMSDFSDYTGTILIGTGYQPTAVLQAMRFYIKTKYRKHMNMPCEEIKKLAFDSYNQKFKGLPADYWLLTSEKARTAYHDDKLVNTSFTPQFFCEFLKGMCIANSKMHKNPCYAIPQLFISGEKDPVGNFEKGINKVVSAYQDKNALTYYRYIKNRTHDILHDADCEKVYDIIESFIYETMKESNK